MTIKQSITKHGAIISPPQTICPKISQAITSDRVDAANQAFERQKRENSLSLMEDVEELKECLKKYRFGQQPFNQIPHMARITLNLKSISQMYGYPLATEIARLLYQLLESRRDLGLNDRKVIKSVKLYINALQQIYKGEIQDSQQQGNASHLIPELGKLNLYLGSN